MSDDQDRDLIELGIKKPSNALEVKEAQRAMQEVQAAYIIAKKYPRDINESYTRIIESCKRKGLASVAMFAFPKGGQSVTGPSIRMAEVLAQNWGNLNFGIVEIENKDGQSVVESYCTDLETNVIQRKVFTVKHERYVKSKGMTKITDPRDIYEHIANYGARRLRACILGIIPQDIVEDAISQCEKTLSSNKEPISERIKKMIIAFKEVGVTIEMLESRIGHKLDVIIEQEIINLQKIFISIKDGFSKREDWFTLEDSAKEVSDIINKKDQLKDQLKDQSKNQSKEQLKQ